MKVLQFRFIVAEYNTWSRCPRFVSFLSVFEKLDLRQMYKAKALIIIYHNYWVVLWRDYLLVTIASSPFSNNKNLVSSLRMEAEMTLRWIWILKNLWSEQKTVNVSKLLSESVLARVWSIYTNSEQS